MEDMTIKQVAFSQLAVFYRCPFQITSLMTSSSVEGLIPRVITICYKLLSSVTSVTVLNSRYIVKLY